MASARWASFPVEVAEGLSVLGTKTIEFFDSGKIKIHDSGGLGAERTLRLASAGPWNLQVFPIHEGRQVKGIAIFDDGVKAVLAVKDNPTDFIDSLLPRYAYRAAADFDSQINLCTRIDFLEEAATIHARLPADYPDKHPLSADTGNAKPKATMLSGWLQSNSVNTTLGHVNWLEFYKTRIPSPPDHLILFEQLTLGECYLSILVRDGRLSFLRGETLLGAIPLSMLDWAIDQRSRVMTLKNQCTLAGALVREIRVNLATASQAETLTKHLSQIETKTSQTTESAPPKRQADVLSDVVHLVGRLSETREIREKVDALLTPQAIEFRSIKTGDSLCRFELDEPSLRVSGTSEEFIIFTDGFGPLTVSRGSGAFRQRLNENRQVKTAARKSLHVSPFTLSFESDRVLLKLTEDHLEILGLKFNLDIQYTSISGVQGGLSKQGDGVVSLACQAETLHFTGLVDQAEAFHRALMTRLLTRKYRKTVEEMTKSILGLEGDYFLYTIFAPFYHFDRVVKAQHILDEPGSDSTERVMNGLALLAQGGKDLQHHLEMVTAYLPNFIARCDARLADKYDAIRLSKEQERGLRRIFFQVNPILMELSRIVNMVATRTGVQGKTTDYGPLAISLVGASLFSPICLLSGAQHALRSSSRDEQQKDVCLQTLREILTIWRKLVDQSIPLLSYYLVEDIFPHRIKLAKALAALPDSDDGKRYKALTKRYARLDTFFRYPEDSAMDYPRQTIIETIKNIREQIHHEPFKAF